MKHTLLALCLFIGTACFAQNATSETEYNFATAGYIRVVNEGADMKAGYTVTQLVQPASFKTWRGKEYFNMKGLYNNGKLRAIMAVHTIDDKVKQVFCIPLFNSSFDLWTKYREAVKKLDGTQTELLNYNISIALAVTAAK